MSEFGRSPLNAIVRLWYCTAACFFVATVGALSGCVEPPQQQLLSAIVGGDATKVQQLLDDPNVNVNWQTSLTRDSALYSAAAYDRVEIVHLLLRRGANPNITTDDQQTPLQLAAYFGSTEVVEMLIAAGADVNTAETANGHTALVAAARNGHTEVIRMLLDAGADRSVRIKDGRVAYQVARQYGHLEAANLLLSYKPNSLADGAQ
jgi:ankyrin repeat protein